MIEDIVSGLIITAIGAYTYLAYNHPREFRLSAPFLAGLGLLATLIMLAYNFGASDAYLALIPLLEADSFNRANEAVDGATFPGWLLVGLFPALWIYLAILWAVSFLKKKKDEAE